MMPTDMRHIDQQHQGEYTSALRDELAATERGTIRFWTEAAINTTHPPVTTAPIGEACSVAEQRNTPATDATTVTVGDTLRVVSRATDPLGVLRQRLIEIRSDNDTTSRTMRDTFDPMRRIGVDV